MYCVNSARLELGRAISGGLGPASEPAREPEVQWELERLHSAVSALETRLDQLCDRLAPVVLAEPPNTANGQGVTASAGSMVGRGIQNNRERVDMLTLRVDSMLNRLAV